jgi:hypothetical protein
MTVSEGSAAANLGISCRYNTTSNRTRIVKTPGGELRLLHIKKRGTAPKCGDCGIKLPGVSASWNFGLVGGAGHGNEGWVGH